MEAKEEECAIHTIESRGYFRAVQLVHPRRGEPPPVEPIGTVATPMMGRLRLAAGGETLHVEYDCGDVQIDGLGLSGLHLVTYSELFSVSRTSPSLMFFRRHGGRGVDVEYTIEATAYGVADRDITARACTLVGVSLVERDNGTALRYTLAAERLEGNLFDLLGIVEVKP
jgi:hypothetical protein